MSHFAPPRADPHGLRAAAGGLTQVGRTLDDRGEHIASVGTAALSSWQGGASLLMVDRTRDLRRVTGQQRQALTSMAQATKCYADEVERATVEVRRLNELWDDAVRHAHQQAAAAAAAAVRAARVAAERAAHAGEQVGQRVVRTYDDGSAVLAATQTELEQRYRRLTGQLEDDGYSLQRALDRHDPLTFLPSWLSESADRTREDQHLANLAKRQDQINAAERREEELLEDANRSDAKHYARAKAIARDEKAATQRIVDNVLADYERRYVKFYGLDKSDDERLLEQILSAWMFSMGGQNGKTPKGDRPPRSMKDLRRSASASARGLGPASNRTHAEPLKFSSEKLQVKKFQKHVGKQNEFKEFGYKDAEAYGRGANDMIRSEETVGYTRRNGQTIYYKRSTNEISFADPAGKIQSYYQPSAGIKYFENQILLDLMNRYPMIMQ